MSASHGNTPAAWTAVTIMFVGFLISGIALPFALPWLFFVGLGVVVLGAVAGKVMQMMGMGSTVTYKDARDPEYDHDDGQPSGQRSDRHDRDEWSEAPRARSLVHLASLAAQLPSLSSMHCSCSDWDRPGLAQSSVWLKM